MPIQKDIEENEKEYHMGGFHFPLDLTTSDGVNPVTHPDCIRLVIQRKPGASMQGVKDHVASKYGTDFKKNLKELEGNLVNKVASIKKKLEAKPGKEIMDKLHAELTNAEETRKAIGAFQSKQEVIDAAAEAGAKISTNVMDKFEELASKVQVLGGGVLNESKELYQKFKDTNQNYNVATSLHTIYLPMPDQLSYNEQAEWQGTDLGMLALVRDKIMGGDKKAEDFATAGLGQIGNLVGGGAGALVGTLFGGGVLGGAAVGALGGGANIQAAVESTFRVKTNPFKEQTFGGVPFRPFEFAWTFSPRNEAEVNMLNKIIKKIRTHSKPSFKDASKTIFNYPDEFQIEFLTLVAGDNLKENKNLPRLKPMVCKSVNTNFMTAGWRSFENGAPATVTLQLGFEEIDIVTSGDVEGGY